MYEIVTLGRGWLHYIASAHIMVNVVEEIYQCWNKNWIVFYVKFVLSTKNYGHACNRNYCGNSQFRRRQLIGSFVRLQLKFTKMTVYYSQLLTYRWLRENMKRKYTPDRIWSDLHQSTFSHIFTYRLGAEEN